MKNQFPIIKKTLKPRSSYGRRPGSEPAIAARVEERRCRRRCCGLNSSKKSWWSLDWKVVNSSRRRTGPVEMFLQNSSLLHTTKRSREKKLFNLAADETLLHSSGVGGCSKVRTGPGWTCTSGVGDLPAAEPDRRRYLQLGWGDVGGAALQYLVPASAAATSTASEMAMPRLPGFAARTLHPASVASQRTTRREREKREKRWVLVWLKKSTGGCKNICHQT
jgi:hypothetical protein